MGDPVLPADVVEEDFGGLEGETIGEDLAVVGQHLFGDTVAGQGLGEEAADRPGGGPHHDAGAHAEPGVVVDAGEDLALGPVGQQDAAHHVHLPRSIGRPRSQRL